MSATTIIVVAVLAAVTAFITWAGVRLYRDGEYVETTDVTWEVWATDPRGRRLNPIPLDGAQVSIRSQVNQPTQATITWTQPARLVVVRGGEDVANLAQPAPVDVTDPWWTW